MSSKLLSKSTLSRCLVIFNIFIILSFSTYAHSDEVEEKNLVEYNQGVNNLEQTIKEKSSRVVLIVSIITLALVLLSIYIKPVSDISKILLFLGIMIPVLAATTYLAGSTIYLNLVSSTTGPVHWHADFELWNCGEKIDLIDPHGLTNRVGSSTFHEHGDDRIHVEGVVVDEGDVNLHNFFHVIGGLLTKGFFSIPTNLGLIEMEDEGLCNGKESKLQVFVYKILNPDERDNWKFEQLKIENPESYILSPYSAVPPGDCIIVEFDEEKDFTDKICSSWTLKGLGPSAKEMGMTEEEHANMVGMISDEENKEHDHEEHNHGERTSEEHDHSADSILGEGETLKHGHLETYGPGEAPHLHNLDLSAIPTITDISRSSTDLPPPIDRDYPSIIKVDITAKEGISEIAPGIDYHYWTFDGGVPGPFIRTRVGDTVELTLKNDASNSHQHSIDLHAVTGPGGGAVSMQVPAGESKSLSFKTLNPGIYVYHCATPNVPMHMAHGMYGLILVEPEGGLPSVDKEFYIMQGELYTEGAIGELGFQGFDATKMINEDPEYVVFNGRVKSLVDAPLKTNVGDTVRLFVGNGGVSLISSFHVIGEIFDRVYPEGATSTIHENVQTTIIPAGGATITEFGIDVPGNYILVDHSLARLDRGAWGIISAEGEKNPEVYRALD
jgi:nitrite reductase (NO-forming)